MRPAQKKIFAQREERKREREKERVSELVSSFDAEMLFRISLKWKFHCLVI